MLLRNIVIFLAIVGVVLTGLLYWRSYTEPPPPPLPVQPVQNPYHSSVVATGIIEAARENIEIGSPISGIITKVYVKVSDKVKKGDALFELDNRNLIGRLYVQKASVETAEASLKRLNDQLSRLQSVRDVRAISQDEVKTRENDVAVAEAQLKQARAEVRRTMLLLSRYTVKAPQKGTILKSDARSGEFIQASSQTPVMILGNIEKLQIRVDVDELHAKSIVAGQQATAFLKNNRDDAILLRFVRIEPYVLPKKSLTGVSSELIDTRVLQVIYTFDNNLPFPVYVGEQVDVFINTDTVKKE